MYVKLVNACVNDEISISDNDSDSTNISMYNIPEYYGKKKLGTLFEIDCLAYKKASAFNVDCIDKNNALITSAAGENDL